MTRFTTAHDPCRWSGPSVTRRAVFGVVAASMCAATLAACGHRAADDQPTAGPRVVALGYGKDTDAALPLGVIPVGIPGPSGSASIDPWTASALGSAQPEPLPISGDPSRADRRVDARPDPRDRWVGSRPTVPSRPEGGAPADRATGRSASHDCRCGLVRADVTPPRFPCSAGRRGRGSPPRRPHGRPQPCCLYLDYGRRELGRKSIPDAGRFPSSLMP